MLYPDKNAFVRDLLDEAWKQIQPMLGPDHQGTKKLRLLEVLSYKISSVQVGVSEPVGPDRGARRCIQMLFYGRVLCEHKIMNDMKWFIGLYRRRRTQGRSLLLIKAGVLCKSGS